MAGPVYPNVDSAEISVNSLNVEKALLELALKRKTIYEEIGQISLNAEADVLMRSKEEARLLDELSTKYQKLAEYIDLRNKATTGVSFDAAKALIRSAEQEIENIHELIRLHRKASQIQIQMEKLKYAENHKYFNFVINQAKTLFGVRVEEFGLVSKISDQLLKLGVRTRLLANFLGGIIMLLSYGYNLFNKMDKAAWDFRKALGMTRPEAEAIRKSSEKMAIQYMEVGLTIEEVYRATRSLAHVMGGVHNVTEGIKLDVALFSAQLGVAEEISADFLRNMAAISKSTLEAQSHTMYIAKNIANAAGVPLHEVMKDVGDKSRETLTMMSRVPNIALRSAIELRRMGTSLKQAAASSRHILDFTESMNEEMEASVLLGRSINLQRARELAYRRNLEGSTKEILRIAKSVDFENLDPFQQDAFAKATGKTVEELTNMLQTDRQLERVRRRGTPEQLKQLALYEQMRKENEAAAKARAMDASHTLRTLNNQTRLAAISAKWNALLAKTTEFLLPIVDKLLEMVVPAIDIAMAIAKWSFVLGAPLAMMNKIGIMMFKVGAALLSVVSGTSKFAGFLTKMANFGIFLAKPWEMISKFVGVILTKLGFFGRFLGFFGKLLGPIGWAITAFQAIGGFIKGWNSTTGNWLQKLGGGLMGVLRAIIPWFDEIVKGIKWIWSKVGGVVTFLFKWFTPLGLIIQAFKDIKNNTGGISKSLGTLWAGTKAVLGTVWNIYKFLFKWFTPLGLIIQAVRFVGKNWQNVIAPVKKIWDWTISLASKSWEVAKAIFKWTSPILLVINGIKSIFELVGKIKEKISDAFSGAWGKVKAIWGGRSPSEAGLSIYRGIQSVAPMIQKSLHSPFQSQLEIAKKMMPLIGKVISTSPLGMLFGGGKSLEAKIKAMYFPALNVSPKGTKLAEGVKPKAEGEKGGEKESDKIMSEETGKKIVELLEKILAKDTNINMDGQLLSTQLARQTDFYGGFGANKVS